MFFSDHKKVPHFIVLFNPGIGSSAHLTNDDVCWLEARAGLPTGFLFKMNAKQASPTELPWEPLARWTALAPTLSKKRGQRTLAEQRVLRKSSPTSHPEGLLDWTELYREAKARRRAIAMARQPSPQPPSPLRSPKRVAFVTQEEVIGEIDIGECRTAQSHRTHICLDHQPPCEKSMSDARGARAPHATVSHAPALLSPLSQASPSPRSRASLPRASWTRGATTSHPRRSSCPPRNSAPPPPGKKTEVGPHCMWPVCPFAGVVAGRAAGSSR